MWKTFKRKSLTRLKLDVLSKKTTYNLFYKDMQEKEEFKGATFSQVSTMISREWKKVKTNGKEMKKYIDFYEVEKQQYGKNLQRYQEDN